MTLRNDCKVSGQWVGNEGDDVPGNLHKVLQVTFVVKVAVDALRHSEEGVV